MALQDETMAGHAASVSSARQPGSVDQLTGSKLAAGSAVGLGRGFVMQAASEAANRTTQMRMANFIAVEARPCLLGNEKCPH